jgi:hypothetical protein
LGTIEPARATKFLTEHVVSEREYIVSAHLVGRVNVEAEAKEIDEENGDSDSAEE